MGASTSNESPEQLVRMCSNWSMYFKLESKLPYNIRLVLGGLADQIDDHFDDDDTYLRGWRLQKTGMIDSNEQRSRLRHIYDRIVYIISNYLPVLLQNVNDNSIRGLFKLGLRLERYFRDAEVGPGPVEKAIPPANKHLFMSSSRPRNFHAPRRPLRNGSMRRRQTGVKRRAPRPRRPRRV